MKTSLLTKEKTYSDRIQYWNTTGPFWDFSLNISKQRPFSTFKTWSFSTERKKVCGNKYFTVSAAGGGTVLASSRSSRLKANRTQVRICVSDGKRQLNWKEQKRRQNVSHIQRLSLGATAGADGFQRPTQRFSREYHRPTSKPNHTHACILLFASYTHPSAACFQ